ncbi:MAG: PLP-dependent aminotransferase family protein [Clostridia bacterium]|nr:PLP-dependent aminotransferase family protein [Clostridia bacterium]
MLRFAKRFENLSGSVVREILKLTQQKDIISFGGGMPSADSFPVEELAQLAADTFADHGAQMLQYGTTEGYQPLREWIAGWLQAKGWKVTVDNILIISGSQQGLDLTSKAFLDPGDQVVIESPSYLAAFQIFSSYQASYLAVPSDDEGMRMDELEKVLANNSPKLMYTIPTFQNPTGITMTLERRKKLIELANKYNVIVIEDDPYGYLRYSGEELPSLKALDTEDKVIYMGSFSKIVAPGLRVGFAVANQEILGKLVIGKQASDVHTSNLSQQIIYRYCSQGMLEPHVEKICATYKAKRDAMLAAMDKHFPKSVTWTKPEGGLFIWCTLPEGLVSTELLKEAVEKQVAFIPGAPFYLNGQGQNMLRLNFSNSEMASIEEGIRRIGEVFSKAVSR